MYLVYYKLLLSYLLYVHVGANGIVKQGFKEGKKSVPTDFLKPSAKYKEFVECTSEHSYITTKRIEQRGSIIEHKTPHLHVFSLQCFQLEKSDNKIAVLYFNTIPVDRLYVTSCDVSKVKRSIFPPKFSNIMGTYYSEVHDHKKDGFTSHFRFIKEDGKCYERLYRLELDRQKEEFELVERKGITELTTIPSCGEISFTCRASGGEIKAVGEYGKPAEWTPYRFGLTPGFYGNHKEVTVTRKIECLVQLPEYKNSDVFYELICVEAQEKTSVNYLAFVNHGGSKQFATEKFTVSSCAEDDLVNAIFVVRDKEPQINSGRLRFKHDEKCYEREYVEGAVGSTPAREIHCPGTIFDWVNPKQGSTLMWSYCYGPSSNGGKPETLENE